MEICVTHVAITDIIKLVAKRKQNFELQTWLTGICCTTISMFKIAKAPQPMVDITVNNELSLYADKVTCGMNCL